MLDDELLRRAVADWPARTVAVGVTDATQTIATTGPVTQPFRLASVTKLLVAMACWVAVEEETLVLDQSAGPAGSTVRHLLAHASGLAPDAPGPVAAPGTRRIYSNTGFDVLGDTLHAAAGLSPAEYLHEAVLAPLGCTGAALRGSPAHAAVAAVTDLLLVGRELLRPTLVHPDTLRAATTAQFPDLAGVLPGFGRQDPNPWGLGVELRGHKHPHWTGSANSPGTFGHFGRAGTFLWVDPAAGLAVAALTDLDFGPWAAAAWPVLSDAVLAAAR
ncbi:MAG: serine hydrolase domain-containing protein [Acidimicrobiales bacterium]